MRHAARWISVALLALSACNKPSTMSPTGNADEIRTESQTQSKLYQEEEVRRAEERAKRRLVMQERLARVAKPIAAAGQALCHDMMLAQDAQGCRYHYELDQSGPLNAFADGSTIHVTPAMMRFVDSDDELAYILAHETAHNIMGHVAAERQNAMIGTVVGVLLDGFAASQGINTHGQMTGDATNAAQLAFSPEFEMEADYVGLYIDKRAGFDLYAAPDVWRRMSMEDESGVTMRTSHPTNPERFVAMKKTIAEIEAKQAAHQRLLPNRLHEQAVPSQLISPRVKP